MLLKIILEGIGLGMILVLCCTVGIHNGAVGMLHLYHRDVQERCIKMGLITKEQISKRSKLMKSVMMPVYLFYLLLAVYVVNGAGDFVSAALQCFAILSILNLVDRILVDELWVGHTKAWTIPSTEDLKPYIKKQDRIKKWIIGTMGFALVSCIFAGVMSAVLLLK